MLTTGKTAEMLTTVRIRVQQHCKSSHSTIPRGKVMPCSMINRLFSSTFDDVSSTKAGMK